MTATQTVATSAGIAERIGALLGDFSLEAVRPKLADLDALAAAVPAGTRVHLSALPHRGNLDMVEPARRLRQAGLEPMPHLAARNFASAEELREFLNRMNGEAGVRAMLVIAGDRDQPAGPFASALEVIDGGLLPRHGIAEIGISGYPDGHPRIAPDVLDRALAAKIEAAEQTGLKLHIITQFCFDSAAILTFLERLRDVGIDHPVRVGLAGPTSLAALLGYARRCGVRASAQGLARQAGLMKHLVGTAAPDRTVRGLAEADVARKIGAVKLHFFSFGGLAATARWANATAAARFTLDREGFSVEPA